MERIVGSFGVRGGVLGADVCLRGVSEGDLRWSSNVQPRAAVKDDALSM